MKKKTKIVILSVLFIILLVLLVPVPSEVYKDGGTRTYTALTYKIVKWRVLVDANYKYENTSVFWFPDNFKTYAELWEIEMQNKA